MKNFVLFMAMMVAFPLALADDSDTAKANVSRGESAFQDDVYFSDEIYTGKNNVLRTKVPQSTSWFGVPYKTKRLDSRGDDNYDKVMFFIEDFGKYLVAGARHLQDEAVGMMDTDGKENSLRKVSEASLWGWRTDLKADPKVVEEAFFESHHGFAIKRVYFLENGSLLSSVQLTPENIEKLKKGVIEGSDTTVTSIVARKGSILVYVLAEDDSAPDDPVQATNKALALFEEITVLPLND